jgi:hypothetical protein
VGDLEIRRAQDAKAPARPVAGEVTGDHRCNRWITAHAPISFFIPAKILSITRSYCTAPALLKGLELIAFAKPFRRGDKASNLNF